MTTTHVTPSLADQPYALNNTGAGFLTLESVGALAIFATYSIAAGDPPKTCSWCGSNGFDEGLRDAFRMQNPRTPATLSHVLSVGVIPAAGLGALIGPAVHSGHGSYAWKDAWVMTNVFLLTTGIADGTKKLVARQRPAFHHGVQDQTEAKSSTGEANLSFFSGDTAWAFSLASSATTLAYLRGYKSAPYIGIAGGTLALLAGTLRISADMHWATDVIAGAAVGTLTGIGLPLLLHRRVSAPTGAASGASVAPLSAPVTGVMLNGQF